MVPSHFSPNLCLQTQLFSASFVSSQMLVGRGEVEGNRAKVLYPQIVIFQYAPVDVLFDSLCFEVVVLAFSCFSFDILPLAFGS